MDELASCESEPFGKGFRCPACLAPHRLDRKGRVPIRHCLIATKRLNERLKSGPCFYEGEPAGKVDCRTCAGAVQIKTFACNCPHVPQPRAAWSEKALPEDVAKCGGCSFYSPRRPTHEGKACHGCGEPATQLCGFNGIFVCGAPLCDRCEHTGPGEHGPKPTRSANSPGV